MEDEDYFICVCVCAILSASLTACGRDGQTGTTAATSNLVVTGERGGDLGHQRCVEAGTATSNNDASDTYVYVLLIKYPIDLSKTAAPQNPKASSIVDQAAGLLEIKGDTSLGPALSTRFVLAKQTLVINDVTVDLKSGSVVMIELALDGKIKVLGQCAASVPFNDDAVKYVESLKPKCAEVVKFTSD